MASSRKVNPEPTPKSARRPKGDNFATGKFTKFSSPSGGLKGWDVCKAVLQILLFILLGYIFYGISMRELSTYGGRGEYTCSTDDFGDATVPEILCSAADGWRRWDVWDSAYFVMVTITTGIHA